MFQLNLDDRDGLAGRDFRNVHAASRAPFGLACEPGEFYLLAVLIGDVLLAGLQVNHYAIDLVLMQLRFCMRLDIDREDLDAVILDGDAGDLGAYDGTAHQGGNGELMDRILL